MQNEFPRDGIHTSSNIYDGAFCENGQRLKSTFHFRKLKYDSELLLGVWQFVASLDGSIQMSNVKELSFSLKNPNVDV